MNVFTECSPFFAAPYLAEVLGAKLYVLKTEYNDFFGSATDVVGQYCGVNAELIPRGDLTVIGTTALQVIAKRIHNFRRVNFIACDTKSREKHRWLNSFLKGSSIHVYAMPDLIPYFDIEVKPILQFIKIDKSLILPKQENQLLITHSPSTNVKRIKKGTRDIQSGINTLKDRYDFDYRVLSYLSMEECLKEKSKSHIFISQLVKSKEYGGITYNGGIGKSGLEAMILQCCVITSGDNPRTEPYFQSIPIVFTNHERFAADLEALIADPNKRRLQIERQNQWLKQYNTPEFFKSYLT